MKPAAQRYEREPRKPKPQYQLEMGTKSLLATFFALAVVCGLFFAFGYTIGKHAIPATFSLGAAKPPPKRQPVASAPGVQPPDPQQLGAAETNQTPTTLSVQPPSETDPGLAAAAAATPKITPAAATAAAPQKVTPPPASTPAPSREAAKGPMPEVAAPGTGDSGNSQLYEVQVFAGSAGDANSLADALKARGYPASVASAAAESGSSFFRVEVGPYLTRAEAQAMRARLRADGYQAVLRIGQ